jgi:hypothetical protein
MKKHRTITGYLGSWAVGKEISAFFQMVFSLACLTHQQLCASWRLESRLKGLISTGRPLLRAQPLLAVRKPGENVCLYLPETRGTVSDSPPDCTAIQFRAHQSRTNLILRSCKYREKPSIAKKGSRMA